MGDGQDGGKDFGCCRRPVDVTAVDGAQQADVGAPLAQFDDDVGHVGAGWPRVANAKTGDPLAAMAIGPWRRSAAEKAAVNLDVVSSILSAASRAAPYNTPLATVTRRSAPSNHWASVMVRGGVGEHLVYLTREPCAALSSMPRSPSA